MDELACAWTQCCQAAGMTATQYLQKLGHWMKVDSIGFYSDLESTIIPELGKEYCDAFEAKLKKRLEAFATEIPKSVEREKSKIDWESRNVIKILKKLYVVSKNATEFVDFCERFGTDQKDCLELAGIFYDQKQLQKALEWAEKGLKLKEDRTSSEDELKKLHRKILKDSGRGGEAVTDAWADFLKHPSIYSFESVLESAEKKEHAGLKSKALPIFEKTDLNEAAVALHKLQEFDLLSARLATEKNEALQLIFYWDAIPIAEALSKTSPKQAARLYVAQAFEILREKRAKAYYHAHDYLQNAKTLLEKSGEAATWPALVMDIRREHRLKSSFMPGFEKIVSGDGPPREPTFKERIAKKLDQSSFSD